MRLTNLWTRFKKSSLYTVSIYAIFGTLWITLSDQLLLLMVPNREILSKIQTYKGWLFIVITSILLLYLIRKHRRRVILEANENFQVLQMVPIPLVYLNLQGKILFVNPTFQQVFGYMEKDIPDAQTWFQKAYPDPKYREMVMKDWAERAIDPLEEREKNLSEPPVYRVRDKNGQDKTVEFFTMTLRKGVIVICKDITGQLKNLEELRQNEKMRALGQLAGGIAHDFNNHLSAIMGYADLISQTLREESAEREFLDSIQESAEISANLTRRLLAFGRKSKSSKILFDVIETLHSVKILAERTFPKNLAFQLNTHCTGLEIMGDPSQIENLILNLIINARDVMKEGGKISINTREKYCEQQVINGLTLQGGDYLCISVKDQGPGIPEDIQQKIFEPFFTTKDKNKGSGLGLATVYSTLDDHHGSIEIVRSDKRGTVFTLYLPLPHSVWSE